MLNVIFIIVTLILLGVLLFLIKLNKKLKQINIQINNDNKKILSQKKSSEVRLGKIGENMAPFINDWPYDHRRFRFIGDPIDGIQFTKDEIIFVEIKTGKSRLTTSQKEIKNLVTAGKVSFATFRIGEHGCSLKKEKS